jgi:hypothetical protein
MGCKPVETEVVVESQWVADVAGVWYPTATELKRVISPAVIRRIGPVESVFCRCGRGPYAVICEVKTTRADFLRDGRKWSARPPAHICCVAYPTGILKDSEIPSGWYGLEMTKEGKRIRKIHRCWCMPHPMHVGVLLDFVSAVSVRRDHRTRYAAGRAFNRAYNADETDRKRNYSAARLLEGMSRWLRGEVYESTLTCRELLPQLGIKKPPAYLEPVCQYLDSLKEIIRGAEEESR